MAAPSISTYILSNSSHYYGSEGGAAVMTSPSDSVTKVSAIISQTSGGAAIETVETTVKTSSDQFADRWALSWHTAGITASPYYVRMWATNSDGDGATREVAPYIYFPPSVSVTSPVDGSTLTDSSVTMAWTAADDYGISYQRVSVSHGGTELWGAEVEGSSIAVPSSVVFENGESYSFSVMARNGKGMESTATNTASFSFVAPSVPALVIAEGDGKSASITVTDSSYTESGTVLEASSAMMESLTIHGLSVQDGTPTPSAPVAIQSVQSVNIFDQSGVTGGIRQGTNNPNYCYWQNDVLTNVRSIGAHGYWCFDYPMKSPVGAGKQLFISFDVKLSGTNATQQVLVMLQASDTTTAFTDNSYVEVAAKDTWEHFEVVRTVASGYSAGDTCYLLIESGNSGNSVQLKNVSLSAEHGGYIPFGSVALVSDTGNILDLETELASAYFISGAVGKKVVDGTGLVSAANTSSDGRSSNYVSSDLFAYLQAGTYTFSWFVASAGTGTSSVVTVRASDSTYITGKTAGASVFASDGNVSFTLDAPDTIGIQFKLYNATARFMLTQGTVVPTAYEPYSGTTTPIDLQGNALRSLTDGTADELRAEDGTETFIKAIGYASASMLAAAAATPTALTNYVRIPCSYAMGDDQVTPSDNRYRGLCNVMQFTGGGFSSDTLHCYTNGRTVYLFAPIGDKQTWTAATAAEWITEHNVEVIAALATPQEIDLGTTTLPYVDGSAWVDAEVTPTIEATFRPVDFPDQPAADSVDVVRVNADGSTWTVASGLSVGDAVTDPLPPLGVDAVYKAVGKTSAGGMSEKLFMHGIPTTGWVLNFGDAAQETVGFIYNPQATMTLAQGGESYHFADGGMGGGFPVFYPTTDRDASGTLAFDTVLYGDSDRLLGLCRRYPVAWLRDPFGHRWRAHVRPSVSHGVGQVWPVTIAWDAVRFEEV